MRAVEYQMCDAVRQRLCFASSCASDNEQGRCRLRDITFRNPVGGGHSLRRI